MGTTRHEQGSPQKSPPLHLASPETPSVGKHCLALWNSPEQFHVVRSQLRLLVSSADTTSPVPRSLLPPEHLGCTGKKGLKPASTSLSPLYRAASRSFLHTEEMKYSRPSCLLPQEPCCSVQKTTRRAPGRLNKIQQD